MDKELEDALEHHSLETLSALLINTITCAVEYYDVKSGGVTETGEKWKKGTSYEDSIVPNHVDQAIEDSLLTMLDLLNKKISAFK